MEKDLFSVVKNQTIYRKQLCSNPNSRTKIIKSRDLNHQEVISFPSVENSPNKHVLSPKKPEKTFSHMKNYVEKIKKQKKKDQKRKTSKTQIYMDMDLPIQKRKNQLKLPQFCQGEKISLRTIDMSYNFFMTNNQTDKNKQKIPQFNLEAQKQKQKITQLLRKIKEDKEKITRLLSPPYKKKSKEQKRIKQIQQIKIQPNPFSGKQYEPWTLEKKNIDFSIEDYRRDW